MLLHEYQAKEVFKSFDIPTTKGKTATTPEGAGLIASELAKPVVIKAQVHAGGRGKAGGIRLAATPAEAEEAAIAILGMDIKGITVHKVLVTEAVDVAHEYYLSMLLNREHRAITVVASREGGVDIEETAQKHPEAIFRLDCNGVLGMLDCQAKRIAYALSPKPPIAGKIAAIVKKMYAMMKRADCSLIEINPLALTKQDDIVALDAKVILDDNGLERHPQLKEFRDVYEENPEELLARWKGLSFVKLDGDVGCIVNGAGLAMATMDLIKHYGGRPANFLDVGGSSNPRKMVDAFSVLLRDQEIRAILVNIFGGITRCDDVANGLVAALERVPLNVPLVVRLAGTNADEGKRILEARGISAWSDMDDAVHAVIKAASGVGQ